MRMRLLPLRVRAVRLFCQTPDDTGQHSEGVQHVVTTMTVLVGGSSLPAIDVEPRNAAGPGSKPRPLLAHVHRREDVNDPNRTSFELQLNSEMATWLAITSPPNV
jgi:hypothetical protein